MRGQAALLILPDIQWHRQAKGKLLASEEGRHQDASKSGADGISGIYNRSRPKSKVRQEVELLVRGRGKCDSKAADWSNDVVSVVKPQQESIKWDFAHHLTAPPFFPSPGAIGRCSGVLGIATFHGQVGRVCQRHWPWVIAVMVVVRWHSISQAEGEAFNVDGPRLVSYATTKGQGPVGTCNDDQRRRLALLEVRCVIWEHQTDRADGFDVFCSAACPMFPDDPGRGRHAMTSR